MSKIAYNIKRLRTAKGITQEAFAKTVNVSRQAISSWETGRTQPDIEMIGTLSDALGVSVEELIYGEKRNVKIDDTERKYVSTATVVLSVLGGLMMLAGAILILVWSWEHIPVFAKTVFAAVPMALGAGFSVFVLIRMNGDSFMEELSAAAWALGNLVTVLFINELFEYNFSGAKTAFIILALTLPVLFVMKSVSALTAIYGIMAYIMSTLWSYFYDREINFIITLLTVFLAVGILFIALYGKGMDYSRRRYGQLITVLATLHYVYRIFVDSVGINPFVALLTVFAICNILEKEKDLTDPLYLFGTAGSAVGLLICLATQGDLLGGDYGKEIPVLLLSVLAFVLAVWKSKASLKENIFKRLQLTVIAAGAVFSAIHSAAYTSAYSMRDEASALTVALDSASVFVFAFCVFVLSLIFIMQGLKENRLYPLNLGFVSIAVLAIMLLTELQTDMLIKGCVLLIMGGILMFMNLKITKQKEKTKKSEVNSLTQSGEATE